MHSKLVRLMTAARAGAVILAAGLVVVAATLSAAEAAKKKAARGGYSYTIEQSINTYGDARGKYGAANSFRDPSYGRQTTSGPFDHGFFFDTGLGRPAGGEAPYMR